MAAALQKKKKSILFICFAFMRNCPEKAYKIQWQQNIKGKGNKITTIKSAEIKSIRTAAAAAFLKACGNKKR